MMQHILNQVRLQAEQVQGGIAKTRVGLVDSYDPSTYSCKVSLQPDNTLTGWLPILSPWVGNGWGLFAPPSIGDLVEVQFIEGDIESGILCQRFYNDVDRPLPTPSGEFWLFHKTGTYFKFTNDGKVSWHSAAEIDAGNLTQTLHTLVTDAFMALFNGHTHPTPSGQSSAPSQQMTTAHLTSVLKAN